MGGSFVTYALKRRWLQREEAIFEFFARQPTTSSTDAAYARAYQMHRR